MEPPAQTDEAAIARSIVRDSTARLSEAALEYVMGDSYKGGYDNFAEYLKSKIDNHPLLPHYYVVLFSRDDYPVLLTDLSVMLRDILFYDTPEVACLTEIKDRLVEVARVEHSDVVKDICELFDIYAKVKVIIATDAEKHRQCQDGTERKNLVIELRKAMHEVCKTHPYTDDWVPP